MCCETRARIDAEDCSPFMSVRNWLKRSIRAKLAELTRERLRSESAANSAARTDTDAFRLQAQERACGPALPRSAAVSSWQDPGARCVPRPSPRGPRHPSHARICIHLFFCSCYAARASRIALYVLSKQVAMSMLPFRQATCDLTRSVAVPVHASES